MIILILSVVLLIAIGIALLEWNFLREARQKLQKSMEEAAGFNAYADDKLKDVDAEMRKAKIGFEVRKLKHKEYIAGMVRFCDNMEELQKVINEVADSHVSALFTDVMKDIREMNTDLRSYLADLEIKEMTGTTKEEK